MIGLSVSSVRTASARGFYSSTRVRPVRVRGEKNNNSHSQSKGVGQVEIILNCSMTVRKLVLAPR